MSGGGDRSCGVGVCRSLKILTSAEEPCYSTVHSGSFNILSVVHVYDSPPFFFADMAAVSRLAELREVRSFNPSIRSGNRTQE